ncbi:MAG: hypothetical protein ACRYGK_10835 [Janthinobacterium lividum]
MHNELILIARALAAKLGEHRTSNVENALSKVFRELPEDQQLEMIHILLKSNVRAAAAIAARGGISVAQQVSLLEFLLKAGHTNSLKVMINKVFAHKLGAGIFTRLLEKHRAQYPKSVCFASYYFLGVGAMNPKLRCLLGSLSESTKP